MANWKLCVILLLPLCVATEDSEVTLVKTIGSKPDVTPLCTNSTLDIVILIVCKIRTQRNGTEECRLLYQYGHDFVHECDSRFKLMTENQTFYLHLTSLTPVDSGNYTCECSGQNGIFIQHLDITVEDEVSEEVPPTPPMSNPWVLVGATVVIMITGVIVGLIYGRIRNGGKPVPVPSHQTSEPEDIEPYSTFIRRESGLYSTVKVQVCTVYTEKSTKEGTHAEKHL